MRYADDSSVADIIARLPLLKELPILDSVPEFLKLLKEHQVVIVEAETGSGKSTGLAPILVEAGFSVLQTQPRELGAYAVASRIAEVLGVELGKRVGYRTARQKQMDGPDTRCLVVTDGLSMVWRIQGHGRRFDVVMPDEVHECNTNMEVQLALIKRDIAAGSKQKVVIMSATMESDELSKFFGGAPILRVAGRMFPVEERRRGLSLERDAVKLLRAGHNVLIFQPGKAEIRDCINEIREMAGMDFIILPLHRELPHDEQRKCFKHYSRPKCIVATNVAQTSITIDDIDAVLDSGMERRIDVIEGVQGLYKLPISLADRLQRMGRAGRCKPGVYIDYCDVAMKDRPRYPVPEIKRTLLDQTFLKLADAGLDMEKIEFFHQPDIEDIRRAKRILMALGCLDKNLQVTAIGRDVARLPIQVQCARMIVEAARLGVVGDLLTIAAILEQGGIVARDSQWLELVDNECQSDCLAQLKIFNMVRASGWSKAQMMAAGVHVVKYLKAESHRKLLVEAVKGVYDLGSTGKRDDILRCICAGMVGCVSRFARTASVRHKRGAESERVRRSKTYLLGNDGVERQLAEESVVKPLGDGFYFGLPFNLENLRLATMVTYISHQDVDRLLPHMILREEEEPFFDQAEDGVFFRKRTTFAGIELECEVLPASEHPEAANVFAQWCIGRMTA